MKPKNIDLETISKGAYGGITSPEKYLVQNTEDWKQLWERINSGNYPAPVLPEINFNKDMIIAVFMGAKSSGGYKIEVDNIKEYKDCLEVKISETFPESKSISSMALSQPYHIVKAKAINKKIKYI